MINPDNNPSISEGNPDSWVPDKLFGYGFYNHVNAAIDNGRYYSISTGSSLDLDGLFGNQKIQISESSITGFIKFKNLLALYPDVTSAEFREGFNDIHILKFFDRINPAVSNATNESDRFKDIISYYLGDESAPGKLRIENGIYVYAKRFNAKTDQSARTVDGNENPLTDEDVWFGYGKRIYTEDGSINQYITLGVLPKVSTLTRLHIDSTDYKTFID